MMFWYATKFQYTNDYREMGNPFLNNPRPKINCNCTCKTTLFQPFPFNAVRWKRGYIKSVHYLCMSLRGVVYEQEYYTQEYVCNTQTNQSWVKQLDPATSQQKKMAGDSINSM